jgi:hypothetical protein
MPDFATPSAQYNDDVLDAKSRSVYMKAMTRISAEIDAANPNVELLGAMARAAHASAMQIIAEDESESNK